MLDTLHRVGPFLLVALAVMGVALVVAGYAAPDLLDTLTGGSCHGPARECFTRP